ncbi:3-oxoacyl-[acyl-carrier-protein] reductase [candidate division WOR-3 bacterium]|nr:3-oxoacyl-[acyl-carrier-protein] reductase [candidate division WOR-3 bacterium]
MEEKKLTAVVTGGARGIGKEITKKLCEKGFIVYIWDVLPEEGLKTAEEIEKTGAQCYFLKVDITDEKSCEEAIKNLAGKGYSVSVLVNNAGITRDNLVMKMSVEDFRKVLEVNLVGAFVCTKSVIRQMIRNKYGKIVNISSVIGLFGNSGQANYASSKAGLIGLTKSTAKEVASKGITVNAICPGFIESDMTMKLPEEIKNAYLNNIPAKRFGSPADVADLVCFLVSDESSYITGEVIRLDGGLAM